MRFILTFLMLHLLTFAGTATFAADEYVYFQDESGLYMDIDSDGWAYWSFDSKAIFSKYEYRNDIYFVYEYGNKWTGNYLSYSRNGYIGVYKWGDSVAWTYEPYLSVKGKSNWKTYEYTKDGTVWVITGDYGDEYKTRNLVAVPFGL